MAQQKCAAILFVLTEWVGLTAINGGSCFPLCVTQYLWPLHIGSLAYDWQKAGWGKHSKEFQKENSKVCLPAFLLHTSAMWTPIHVSRFFCSKLYYFLIYCRQNKGSTNSKPLVYTTLTPLQECPASSLHLSSASITRPSVCQEYQGVHLRYKETFIKPFFNLCYIVYILHAQI